MAANTTQDPQVAPPWERARIHPVPRDGLELQREPLQGDAANLGRGALRELLEFGLGIEAETHPGTRAARPALALLGRGRVIETQISYQQSGACIRRCWR